MHFFLLFLILPNLHFFAAFGAGALTFGDGKKVNIEKFLFISNFNFFSALFGHKNEDIRKKNLILEEKCIFLRTKKGKSFLWRMQSVKENLIFHEKLTQIYTKFQLFSINCCVVVNLRVFRPPKNL